MANFTRAFVYLDLQHDHRLHMAFEESDAGCDMVDQVAHLTTDLEPAALARTESTTKAAATDDVTFTSNSTSASVTFGPAERRRTVTACLSYLSGSCKRDDCRYVHLKPEIRLLPSSVCAYHAEGECKRGDGCRYFHGTVGTLNALRRQGVIMYNPRTNTPYDEVPDVLEDPKERDAHKRQQQSWKQPPPAFFQPQYAFQAPPPPPPMHMHAQMQPMLQQMQPMQMQMQMQMQPMLQQMQPLMMAPQPQHVQYIQLAPNGMMPVNYLPMMQPPMQQPVMMGGPQQMVMVAADGQHYGYYSNLS
jgi:hypothetical protein